MRETISNRTPLRIAEDAAKGPDPDVVACLENENVAIDVDELIGDLDLPPDQMEMLKQTLANVDMTQSYIENSIELANAGNHAEVIRILKEHRL